MTHDDLLPCGHPAACLRDGACGWCEAVDDARLHLEERDELRAHVERLREALSGGVSALDVLMGDTDLEADDSEEFLAMQQAAAALASTPADSLEARDREVAARALEEAAEAVADLEPTWNLGEAGAYVRAAEVLRAHAAEWRKGQS